MTFLSCCRRHHVSPFFKSIPEQVWDAPERTKAPDAKFQLGRDARHRQAGVCLRMNAEQPDVLDDGETKGNQ